MPKVVDTAKQKREIRDAARRVFARRGVEATGLAHVAEATGMGRSSLYHYYPDKGSLIRDLSRDLFRDEEALFVGVLEGEGSPLERVLRLAAGVGTIFDGWAAVGRVLFDLRHADTRRFRSFFRRIRSGLAATIAEGQALGEIDPEVDAELVAATLIGALDGLLLQRLVDRDALADTRALGDALVLVTRKVLAA